MTGIGTELLGVIAVGIGMAALLFAMSHAGQKAGLKLPPWLLPAGIGLAMVSYSVWNDYAWFGRTTARLPGDAQVLLVGRASQPWAPWTYLAPVEVRFAAMDRTQVQKDADGIRQVPIMLVERRGHTVIVPQEFDCAGHRIRPARGDWTAVAADDPAFAAVCAMEG